jgi:hypothetical protein
MSKIFPFNQSLDTSNQYTASGTNTASGVVLSVKLIDAGDFIILTYSVVGTAAATSGTSVTPVNNDSSNPATQIHSNNVYDTIFDNASSAQGTALITNAGLVSISFITAKVYNYQNTIVIAKTNVI